MDGVGEWVGVVAGEWLGAAFGSGYERGREMGEGASSNVGNGLCLEFLSPCTSFWPTKI